MPDLLQCPFCGCEKVKYFNGWQFGDRDKHIERTGDLKASREPAICCEGCGIGMTAGDFGCGISDGYAERYTVAAWNRRPSNESGKIDTDQPVSATEA